MKHRKTGKLSIPFNEGIYLELIYYLILFEIEEKKGFSTVNLTMKLNLIASHFTSKSRIIRYKKILLIFRNKSYSKISK